MSKSKSLDIKDGIKILKGFGLSVAGVLVANIAAIVQNISPDYVAGVIIVTVSTGINAAMKYFYKTK